MTLSITLLVFLTGFALLEALLLWYADAHGSRRAQARDRLRRLSLDLHASHSGTDASILLDGNARDPRRGSRLAGARLFAPFVRLLRRADRPLGLEQLLALELALFAVAAVLGAGASGDARIGFAAGAAVSLLPVFWLRRRARQRARRFEAQFPEALDLLTRALRAGHALSAGLQMVGDELADPIGPEFARVSEEVQFGLELPAALTNLAERVDAPDLPFFVTALVVQRETGGNLAEIMDNLAQVIRERHAALGRTRALTAQARWSANILVAAPFCFAGLMALVRPGYVDVLWTTPAGQTMGIAATCMALVGWVVCRRVGVVRI